MAVRRISDLPNLSAQYENVDNTKCLIEVSYSARNNVYQSFYSTLDEIKNYINIDIDIDNLQKASKSQYGIVKVGDNIDVESGDNAGLISIPHATDSKAGVIKTCGASPYVGVDANGNLIPKSSPSGGGGLTEKEIIDLIYPVGSLWFSESSSAIPPRQGHNNVRWIRISKNCSVWITENDSEVGKDIAGSLPFPDFTCESDGNHRHGMMINVSGGSFDDSAQTPGRALTNVSITAPQAPAIDSGSYVRMENWVKTHDITTIDKYNNKGVKQKTSYGAITGTESQRISALKTLLDKGKLNDKSSITLYSIQYSFNAVLPNTDDLTYDDVQNAKTWAEWLIQKDSSLNHMGEAGAHTHTLNVDTTGSAYRAKTDNKTIVRPTSIGVAVWKRTA